MIVLFTASFAQAQMFNIKPLNRLSAGVVMLMNPTRFLDDV